MKGKERNIEPHDVDNRRNSIEKAKKQQQTSGLKWLVGIRLCEHCLEEIPIGSRYWPKHCGWYCYIA